MNSRLHFAGPAMFLLLSGCLRLEGPPPSLENGAPCDSDGQCASGSACEYDSIVFDYVCRVRGGCTGHGECAATDACVFGVCQPAECTADPTCGAYGCNTTVRQCNDSCADDYDCSSGNLCRDGECLSAVCNATTAARVCEGTACSSGTCLSVFDCPYYGCAEGYTCEGSSCVRLCASDSQCERYTCDTLAGECREGCFSETECQAGFVCKDYFCQTETP